MPVCLSRDRTRVRHLGCGHPPAHQEAGGYGRDHGQPPCSCPKSLGFDRVVPSSAYACRISRDSRIPSSSVRKIPEIVTQRSTVHNGFLQPYGEALLRRQRTSDAYDLSTTSCRFRRVEYADLYLAQRDVQREIHVDCLDE